MSTTKVWISVSFLLRHASKTRDAETSSLLTLDLNEPKGGKKTQRLSVCLFLFFLTFLQSDNHT